jgi:hypothetical protein
MTAHDRRGFAGVGVRVETNDVTQQLMVHYLLIQVIYEH